MRLLAVLACLVLGACSAAYDLPPVYAPELSKAMEGAKRGANAEKLVGPVEISAVREAHPLGLGPYILCIRGTNSIVGMRTYAVFLKNNDYVSARMSVIMDNCEAQAFTPLGTGPFPGLQPVPEVQPGPVVQPVQGADRPRT
jgi:hypothetical protein